MPGAFLICIKNNITWGITTGYGELRQNMGNKKAPAIFDRHREKGYKNEWS